MTESLSYALSECKYHLALGIQVYLAVYEKRGSKNRQQNCKDTGTLRWLNSSVDPFFVHCEFNDIPITTHGSDGGFVSDDIHSWTAVKYSNPSRWERVLKKFPNLRLNFAHFGGLKEDWIETIDGYIKAGY